MKNAKLLTKLRALIEDATDADKKHIKKIRKVLRQLKESQNALRDSLKRADNSQDQQKIEQEIAVINLQRGKGVEIYKTLKNARKERKNSTSRPASAAGDSGHTGNSPGADS